MRSCFLVAEDLGIFPSIIPWSLLYITCEWFITLTRVMCYIGASLPMYCICEFYVYMLIELVNAQHTSWIIFICLC